MRWDFGVPLSVFPGDMNRSLSQMKSANLKRASASESSVWVKMVGGKKNKTTNHSHPTRRLELGMKNRPVR